MSADFSQSRRERRAFLEHGSLLLLAASLSSPRRSEAAEEAVPLRVGLVTDLHYADKDARGTRNYRETIRKLDEAAEQFARDQPAFFVEMGDFIDAADSVDAERRYLTTINRPFAALGKDRHYVLGNHCVDTLSKKEFLGGVEQAESFYSFDRGGIHFVILDACFRHDGKPYERKNFQWTDANIPAAELEWLAADLTTTPLPVIVFAHQRLDVRNDHGVKNNGEVRAVFERSKKVQAVFQGHSHQNDYQEIGGIHYCTLVAMVEGSGPEHNGFSLLEISSDGTIRLHGFYKQQNYLWQEG